MEKAKFHHSCQESRVLVHFSCFLGIYLLLQKLNCTACDEQRRWRRSCRMSRYDEWILKLILYTNPSKLTLVKSQYQHMVIHPEVLKTFFAHVLLGIIPYIAVMSSHKLYTHHIYHVSFVSHTGVRHGLVNQFKFSKYGAVQLYHFAVIDVHADYAYRLITAYLLLRVNLDKIMHARWDFDASSTQTRRVSALDKHQN